MNLPLFNSIKANLENGWRGRLADRNFGEQHCETAIPIGSTSNSLSVRRVAEYVFSVLLPHERSAAFTPLQHRTIPERLRIPGPPENADVEAASRPRSFGKEPSRCGTRRNRRVACATGKPFFSPALKTFPRFTFLWLGLLALAAGGLLTNQARAQVTQNLGTLADGESVTVTFEVTISSPLPAGVTQISAVGTVSGDNFATVSTDDPETAALNDPTITAIAQNFDFGDAPSAAQSGFASSYPTLLADNGARHFIPAGGATLYLGSVAPDVDTDGQPDAGAVGDDFPFDDEGGTGFPQFISGGQSVLQVVTVTGGSGFLNGWIDFNRDGDWADPGEQIFKDEPVSAGPNLLNFNVPVSAAGGFSFARFRLTSANSGGTLSFVGPADDGEVEDYRVRLNAAPVAGNDTLTRHTNSPAKIAVSVLLANDTDADLDTLAITAVTTPTANGATVTRDGAWVIYEPPSGFNGADTFNYTISDGRGGTAIGAVNVVLAPGTDDQTQNTVSITPSGADVIVRFAGIPGRTYRIETTADLTPPITWTPHPAGPLVAGSDGVIQLTDTAPPSPRFYRAAEF